MTTVFPQRMTELLEKKQRRKASCGSRADSTRLFHGEVHSPVLQLQRMLGNQRVAQLIQAKRLTPQGKIIGLQPKQMFGAADDRYEQEVDRAARQVMNTQDAVAKPSAERAPSCGRVTNQTLQTKPLAASITRIAHELAHVVHQSGGQISHPRFWQSGISQVPAGSVQRKASKDDEDKKKKAVKQHLDQQLNVAKLLDQAKNTQPDPSKGTMDPDNLYHNSWEMINAGKVLREKNASSSMPGITRYEQPGVCPECEEEIEHRKVAGKQAAQEEELQAMPRPEMKNEVARVNTLSGRSYHPALDEAVLQKQSAQVRLSTRSVGATPAIIRCQATSPEETSGKQRGAGSKPRDIKKLLKDPCFGERVDDSKAQCQFSSKQSIMVRLVKGSALRACTGAIAAINMPGNEERVKQIAKDYFHLDIKLSEKTKRTLIKTIKAVSAKLEHAAIECRTCHDEGCNRGLIAFVESRTVLALCPPFFDSEIHKVYLTPRYLIHEAGHLAGVNTPSRDELYCHQEATKEDKCPVVDAIHNVDAWSHFIEDVASSI